jgi:hypothetical protein
VGWVKTILKNNKISRWDFILLVKTQDQQKVSLSQAFSGLKAAVESCPTKRNCRSEPEGRGIPESVVEIQVFLSQELP